MTGASAATAAARPSADARRWTIIGLLSLGMVIAYVSRSNLSVVLVLPDFIKSFHLSDTDRGILNSAFFWAYAVLQIPAGWVVDRYGVKLPYAVSFLFWCIASALTAFTGTLGSLYVLRVLVGRRRGGRGPRQLSLDPRQLRGEGARPGHRALHDRHQDRPRHRRPARGLAGAAQRLAGDVPDRRRGRPGLAGAVAAAGG